MLRKRQSSRMTRKRHPRLSRLRIRAVEAKRPAPFNGLVSLLFIWKLKTCQVCLYPFPAELRFI